MKKIILILSVLLSIWSCGSSAVVEKARATVDGDWILQDIVYPGGQTLEVTLLNDISSTCLENSKWNFVSNNNTGSYIPVKTVCGTQPRFFRWSIEMVDATTGNYDLMLKPTDENYRSETDAGFRLNLSNLSANRMVWEQTISFEGEPFTIKMNFKKQ